MNAGGLLFSVTSFALAGYFFAKSTLTFKKAFGTGDAKSAEKMLLMSACVMVLILSGTIELKSITLPVLVVITALLDMGLFFGIGACYFIRNYLKSKK